MKRNTNLLDVDTMTGTAEDQASLHGLGKSLSLEAVSQRADSEVDVRAAINIPVVRSPLGLRGES